jgi:uridine phosphorylase
LLVVIGLLASSARVNSYALIFSLDARFVRGDIAPSLNCARVNGRIDISDDRVEVPRTVHILPTAPLAERVLLPGDPGRALRLAQALLQAPKMFNHHRGLWGYTGDATADGRPLTIQSTGMGGPSAAIVVAELVSLGAETLVRVGTCGALRSEIAAGELLIVTEAICEDGTSRALAASDRVAPSADLLARLVAAGDESRQVVAVSTDLFYDRPAGERERWAALGASAVEMETATLLALARRRRVRAASVLLAAETIAPDGRRRWLDPERVEHAERALGELATRALSA